MLSLSVVPLNPGHDDLFRRLEGLEVMQPDTFLLQGSEEALDHPVVLRRVARDELLGDRELLGGPDEQAGQEDGAVVVPEPEALGHLGETPIALDNPLLQGIDGLFVYYTLMQEQLEYDDSRALIEFLVDHDGIQRILQRRLDEVKRDWIKAKLREMRHESGQVSWEDAEAEYDKAHPRVLSHVEEIFARFSAEVPHPELHGGKVQKAIWASMEEQELGFMAYVEKEELAHEEGSLFSYLVRVMNFGRQLHEATGLARFEEIAERVRTCIAAVDRRMEA